MIKSLTSEQLDLTESLLKKASKFGYDDIIKEIEEIKKHINEKTPKRDQTPAK